MANKGDEFLRRWSRRKSESREKLRRTSGTGEEDRQASGMAGRVERSEDNWETARLSEGPESMNARPEPEHELTEEDFKHVDFDALDYGSDYQQFMSKGVPEAIQRKALRKLWQSNPILANIDGLNDYDDDFTDTALAVDAIKTAYKVGRGYLSDEELEEMSKIGKAEAAGDGSDDTAATADDGTVETAAAGDGPERATGNPQGERDDESKDTPETEKKGDSDGGGNGSETI